MTTRMLSGPETRVAAPQTRERKINLMILASHLWIGGAETVIRHLAETVDRNRFNVTVCHLKERGSLGDELARAGVDIVGVDNATTRTVDYFSFRKLLRVIRNRRIDVVHTHTTHGLVDATICKLFVPRLKVVHTFHFGNYPHTSPRILLMEKWFCRFADRLFAVGTVQRAQIRQVHKLRDRDIDTLPNGVVLKGTTGDPSLRERMGAPGRILIGTIATLITQKGLFDLLTVAKKIKDAGLPATFVIVGEGVLRPSLEARRRELGLEDSVVMTGWITDAAEVALPVFDVFFQPSLWEAMSVVILEAMAARKPIVATRAGENPHILEHDVSGVLVDVGDVDGMVAALTRLITDGGLRHRMGMAARQKVESQLTVSHMTRAYEAAYVAAIGGSLSSTR